MMVGTGWREGGGWRVEGGVEAGRGDGGVIAMAERLAIRKLKFSNMPHI